MKELIIYEVVIAFVALVQIVGMLCSRKGGKK